MAEIDQFLDQNPDIVNDLLARKQAEKPQFTQVVSAPGTTDVPMIAPPETINDVPMAPRNFQPIAEYRKNDSDRFLEQSPGVIEEIKSRRVDRNMRASLLLALDADPDLSAKAKQLSNIVNLPEDVIERQYSEVERMKLMDEWQTLLRNSPAMAEFWRDPLNAKITKDDAKRLSMIERMWNQTRSAAPDTLASLDAVSELALRGIGAPTLADMYAQNRRGWQGTAERLRGNQEGAGPVEQAIGQGLVSTVQMAPLLVGGVLTRQPSLPISGAALLAGGSTAGRAFDEGQTAFQALPWVLSDAATEGIMEKIPIGTLFKNLKEGAPFIKTYISQLVREVPTEMATTAIQGFNEWAYSNEGGTFADYISSLPDEEAQTVIATMVATTLLTGASHTTNRMLYRINKPLRDAEMAEAQAARIDDLIKLVGDSNAIKRDPTTMQAFLETASNGTVLQQGYIDGDVLFQSGLSDQLVSAIPSLAEQVSIAKETGGDVSIPMSDFITQASTNPNLQALVDHIRADPSGMSRAEAAAFRGSGMEQEVNAAIEESIAEAEAPNEFLESKNRVKEIIKAQNDAIGRFSSDVNDTYATLVSDRLAVMAAQMGITPEGLYRRYPLRTIEGTNTDNNRNIFDIFKQRSNDTRVAFEKRIDDLYSGAKPNREGVRALDEGDVLTLTGYGNMPVVINESHAVDDGKYNHGLTASDWKKIPEWLDNPVAVFERASDGNLMMIAPEKIGGRAVVIGLAPSAAGAEGYTGNARRHLVLTVYPKDSGELSLKSAVERGEYKPVFVDQKKNSPSFFGSSGIRFPGNIAELRTVNRSIKTDADLVKYRRARDAHGYSQDAVRGSFLREQYFFDKDVVERAKKVFGITNDIRETGYILPDGEMLDFSGKNFGSAEKGIRAIDHSDLLGENIYDDSLNEFLESKNSADLRLEFVQKTGSVRVAPESNIVQSYGYLSDKQIEKIIKYFNGKNIILSAVDGLNGRIIEEKEIDNAKPMQIRRFFDSVKDKEAPIVNAYFQNENKKIIRGFFSPESMTIALSKKADLSTFLHESAHFFWEMQTDVVNRMVAESRPLTAGEQSIVDDTNTVFEWLGVKDMATWNALAFEEKTGYHERFARGFESYLFEGKAPSIPLQRVFQRFRAWLVAIYRDIRNLNVELSDDIRAVFDRMLASGEEITLAEQAQSMTPLFETAEQAGMMPEEFAAYQRIGVDATIDAIQDLQAKGLRDMQWLNNRRSREIGKLKKRSETIRREVRTEVRDEVMSRPVYQAWAFLREKQGSDFVYDPNGTGGITLTTAKLAIGALRDAGYTDQDINLLRERRMTANEGLRVDEIADMLRPITGYDSGDAMIRALLAAESPDVVIDDMTDQRLLEEHGELATTEAIERSAQAAIYNDVRARMVSTELKALTKATGNLNITKTAARDFSRNVIARSKIRDLRPSRFSRAATKSARAAERDFRRGDIVNAVANKRNQMFNHYAASDALRTQSKIEKDLRYLRKFNRNIKTIDVDYKDQIDSILERFDLKQSVSLREIDRRASLAEWIASQEEQGIEPDIPNYLRAESARTHYKNLTVEQFSGLVDTVKQIEHLGRLKHRLLTSKDNRQLKEVVDGIKSEMDAATAGNNEISNEVRNTAWDRLKDWQKGFAASHRAVYSLVREMDGWKDGGAFWDAFVRPMNDAGNREATMRTEAAQKLYEISKPLLRERAVGGKLLATADLGGEGTYFPTLGRSLNRGERIAIALNWGNDGNRQRLLEGRKPGQPWTPEMVAPVLRSLTKTEWQYVQDVWAFFESYRPLIAEKERRVSGKEPEWIEPTPFTVALESGETINLPGGYYPIKYDPNLSEQASREDEAQQAKEMLRAAYTSTTTRRSFTKTRSQQVRNRPLALSLDPMYTAANEIIHDLTWHEWLIDANKLLRSLDPTIREKFGSQKMKALRDAMKDIARGDAAYTNSFEKALLHLRNGSTIVGLGWNLRVVMLQPLGITNSIVYTGAPWIARGLAEFYGTPGHMVAKMKEVQEKSEFMRNRAKTLTREINDVQNQLTRGKTEAGRILEWTTFAAIQRAQSFVDYPTWLGAYKKAASDTANLDNAGMINEEKCIALADQAVISAQSSGMTKDLTGIQRGGAIQKLFTNFYSFFATTFQLAIERTARTNFRSPAQVAALAGDYILLLMVPAIGSELINAILRGGAEDEDELVKNLANEQLSMLLALSPITRELGNAAQILATGEGFSYSGPAGLRFFVEATKLAQQASQGEMDMALFKAANNTGGILFHYPAGQINRTIEGTIALIDGDTDNPLAVLGGKPRQ